MEELEGRQLLHRDIKPQNIILHEADGRAVLIDFGLSVPQGEAARPAGTPLYLPPEAVLSAQPPSTTDRYATAAVLFRVLTGAMPFGPGNRTASRTVEMPIGVTDSKIRRLANVLLRGVANNPAERPASAEALRGELQSVMLALEETDAELPDLTNEWVDKLRGLYRNSAIGNADNRGLDSDFVRQTYVPTQLDDWLLPEILARRPCAVFLSGNPGDGKTAFLEQVQRELMGRGATEIQRDASGWEWLHDGHVFRSCYDASESHRGLSADQQLTEKLAELQGEAVGDALPTVLVAVNDGRLVDFFQRYRNQFAWLSTQVEAARERADHIDLPVWLIDLKRRAFVALPLSGPTPVALRVLDRMVAPAEWTVCQSCAASTVCPMHRNALALRSQEVAQRLDYLLLLAHLRQLRHTTMRDLRSAFAYLITGNTSCEDVHAARHGDTEADAPLIDRAFWHSAFAPAQSGEETLADLTPLDPARFPQPQLDQFLYLRRDGADAAVRGRLFDDESDLPPQRFVDDLPWIAAFKRRLYFHGVPNPEAGIGRAPVVDWELLLPYRHAREFLSLLGGSANVGTAREKLALGILRSDGYSGPARRGRLSLRVAASDEQRLVVLKRFPLDEFILRVDRPPHGGLEMIPEGIALEHASGSLRLEIRLDLFELLMCLADGLQPQAPEYQPLLEDLAAFKSALLLRETTDLVLVEGQRKEHVVTQRDTKIVRVTVAEAPVGELAI